MQCPRCGHSNPEGSRFCANCGNQLEITCPICSERSPVEARFCWNCGSVLASERTSDEAGDLARYFPQEMLSKMRAARSEGTMRGERRTVTMLFADIQGSTAAAEGLDPEDWAEIMNGAFEHLIAPVYRYEGTLARLQGDAVLAFFGAPIAHEDDPVRAVRAGLEIIEAMEPYKAAVLERWKIPIDVRVGINTGLVVVGEVGSDLRVEYTALGDAVNVAARMEQTAQPGTVRITGETWSLVSDRFQAEEIGPVEVKGKSEPVTALRVIAPLGSPVEAPGAVQLVGRAQELEDLERLRDRLLAGTGWLVSIMGEAGVGKTRLLHEFRSATEASVPTAFGFDQEGEIAWLGAASQSYDSSVPYSTVRDLMVRWWGLAQVEDPHDRILGAVESASANGAADLAAYLGHLSGVPLPAGAAGLLDKLEPPVIQSRSREAMMAYLEAEAGRRPLVVALEDIHWTDAMSLALVEDLMRLADRAPVGLLVTMRPYRDEPSWHVHEVAQRDHPHRYQNIALSSLEDDATEMLLDELLEGIEVPAATRSKILARSDGNPLFIAQMARAIRDSSGEDVQVPTGLQSLLTARLDRLEEESRLVAQMASVLGAGFDRSSLAALTGDDIDLDRRLSDLQRREILVEESDTAGTYGFYHALVQEAAYSTILLRTRRELHARVAEHLVATEPDSVEEIARHLLEAERMDEAFPHLVAAGEKTARAMALSDSIRFFTTALENIPADADPDLVVRAHDGLGVAYTLVPDLTQSEATYQRLLDYADHADRPSDKVKALNRLAMTTAMVGGDLDGARRYLEEAFAVATEVGDELGLAEYHMNSCSIAGLGGDVGAAAFHDEETIKAGVSLGASTIRNEGLTRLAVNAVWLMDFGRALPAVEDALEAAREAGDEMSVATIEGMALSRLRLREGDTEGALQLLLSSEATMARYASFYEPIVGSFIGDLLYEQGDVESGISRIAEARRQVVEAGVPFYVAVLSAVLARMYCWVGMTEGVGELRASAVESVGKPLGDFLASTVWADLGYSDLYAGDLQAADETFVKGLASSSASQYWEKPRLLIGRARARSGLGDSEGAHALLDEAQTYLLDKEVRTFDAYLHHARGEAFLEAGEPEVALERLGQAWDLAAASGLRVLAVEVATASARAAMAAGDQNAATQSITRAREEVEAMAGSIVEEGLRAALEGARLAPLDRILAG